jgi:hypothetical protein
VRAGQRPPDRRTAYGPPPLVKAAALSARECLEPGGSGAGTGRTMTTSTTAAAGGMTGDGPRRGRRHKSRALPGGNPTGAASRRLAGPPRSPGLVVARRYAHPPVPAPGVKQRLTGRDAQSARAAESLPNQTLTAGQHVQDDSQDRAMCGPDRTSAERYTRGFRGTGPPPGAGL